MQINGKPWNNTYLEYETLINGGTIEFEMSSTPNTSWGTDATSVPFSLSKSN